jgi:hypothetical protein
MLVIGVVCPLIYFAYYLAAGVTRKQFAAGMFAAAAALSLCFAVLRIPLLIGNGGVPALAVLVPALYGALAFLAGWTASVGFQYARGVPIIIGIVCAVVLFNGIVQLERLALPPLARLPAAAGAICVVWALLLRAVQRIPVNR